MRKIRVSAMVLSAALGSSIPVVCQEHTPEIGKVEEKAKVEEKKEAATPQATEKKPEPTKEAPAAEATEKAEKTVVKAEEKKAEEKKEVKSAEKQEATAKEAPATETAVKAEEKSTEEKNVKTDVKPEAKSETTQKTTADKTAETKTEMKPMEVAAEVKSEATQAESAGKETKPETKPEAMHAEGAAAETKGEAKPEEATAAVKPEGEQAAKKEVPKFFPAKSELEDENASDTPESLAPLILEKEAEGIDTVTLEEPQGNWLRKRMWWEKAEEKYDKIRAQVDKIWMSRMDFFEKRNALDENAFDLFYKTVGLEQGELQQIIQDMIKSLEKRREKEGAFNNEEQDLHEKLEGEKNALSDLSTDVEAISELEKAVEDALKVLMERINDVRKFEKEAWENFKEIARVLDDKKAYELYIMMDGAWTNVKNVGTYIDGEFSTYFDQLIADATKQVESVLGHIKALKEKGVDFKTQVEQVEVSAEEEKKAQKEAATEKENKKKAAKQPQGWIDWLGSYLKAGWDGFVYLICLPYNLIFSKT